MAETVVATKLTFDHQQTYCIEHLGIVWGICQAQLVQHACLGDAVLFTQLYLVCFVLIIRDGQRADGFSEMKATLLKF